MCISLVVIFAIIAVTYSQDYCKKTLCDDGVKHIGCKNDGKFVAQCPSDAVMINFNDKLKQLTLDTHNKYRNEIASGQIQGYDGAAKMATLVWNDELAKLAEMNVRQCVFEHDQCRNTKVFLYAGQNLGQVQNSMRFKSPEHVIKVITKGWFEEYKDADMSYVEKFRHHEQGKMIGHFTQVVRDEAYAVGCAIAQFKKGKWYTILYACDYTLSNIDGHPIYEKSEKPASSCKSGTNPQFPGLCSKEETYNNKLFYSAN